MKTLYIVRHGEAYWDNPELNDYERPLIKKGVNDSKIVANYLFKKKIVVDKIISSSAVRAMETARVFAPIINFQEAKIELNKELYLADIDEIFNVIYSVDDEINSLMIFSHNPGLTELANIFLNTEIEMFPTSAVLSIGIYAKKWTDISSSEYLINFILFPEMIH